MNWRWRPRRKPPAGPLDPRVLTGIPSVFTGCDATYGEIRKQALDMAERHWHTETEKGLAITLLAVVNDFERYFESRETE